MDAYLIYKTLHLAGLVLFGAIATILPFAAIAVMTLKPS